LFASSSVGGVTGRVVLFFLAPLPCYLAGLGWGTIAASIAALSSAALAGLLLGFRTGIVFLLSQGIPLIVLCHLVLLNRPVDADGSTPVKAPAYEWYPTGRVLAAATLMAGALAFVSLLLLGADLDGLRAMMRELVDKVLIQQLPALGGAELGEPERAALANLLLQALPAASAVLWLGGFTINLWLGAKITRVSGRLIRPWPDLGLIAVPRRFGFGLAAALALSLLPELPGLLATGFAGGFLFAYMLVGLSIIHYATRGTAARPFILWGLYVMLIFFNTWAGLLVALIAILEPVMWYRRPSPPDIGPMIEPSTAAKT
jgi:hypothetical protein